MLGIGSMVSEEWSLLPVTSLQTLPLPADAERSWACPNRGKRLVLNADTRAFSWHPQTMTMLFVNIILENNLVATMFSIQETTFLLFFFQNWKSLWRTRGLSLQWKLNQYVKTHHYEAMLIGAVRRVAMESKIISGTSDSAPFLSEWHDPSHRFTQSIHRCCERKSGWDRMSISGKDVYFELWQGPKTEDQRVASSQAIVSGKFFPPTGHPDDWKRGNADAHNSWRSWLCRCRTAQNDILLKFFTMVLHEPWGYLLQNNQSPQFQISVRTERKLFKARKKGKVDPIVPASIGY